MSSNPPEDTNPTKPIPVIDSHIHLFPASHLDTLAWHTPSNPLGSQHSVAQYCEATRAISKDPNTTDEFYLKGFVFIEADRKSSLDPKDWDHALDEVSFAARIASGNPVPGEGHEPADRDLCLAIIPWAPVPAGPEVLKAYMDKVRERMGSDELFKKVKGVRYLLQDKPPRTMLDDKFVQGVKWLGEQGLLFELGIDARQGGLWQLHEAVKLLEKVYEGGRTVPKVVISTYILHPNLDQISSYTYPRTNPELDHMCKPNLHLMRCDSSELKEYPDYAMWFKYIEALARFPATYMKISGLFAEMEQLPSSESEEEEAKLISSVGLKLLLWVTDILTKFTPHRMMFGSDWPVCNVGGIGQPTWLRWLKIVKWVSEDWGDSSLLEEIMGRVAGRVYGCRTSPEPYRCDSDICPFSD